MSILLPASANATRNVARNGATTHLALVRDKEHFAPRRGANVHNLRRALVTAAAAKAALPRGLPPPGSGRSAQCFIIMPLSLIMSGCFFIIFMHLVLLIIVSWSMPWRFFIIIMSCFDMP